MYKGQGNNGKNKTAEKEKMKTILFIVTVLFWFAQYAYTPYVNPQLINMGVTAAFMGFVSGIYGLTQFALRIPVGIFSDKWQKKFFICAGCFFAGLASVCMLIFHNPAGFLVGRALGGVAASSWVACTVLYSGYNKPEHATRAITTINLASQLGRLFSFLAAAIVANYFGAEATFLLSAAVGFIGFALSLFIKEVKAEKKPLTFKELIAVGSEKNLIVTSVLATLVQIIAFATYASFTANHGVYIGATAAQLGTMQVIFLIPGIMAGFLLTKYILKRISAKPLVVFGFLLTAVYCILLPFTQNIFQLYMVQIIGGVSNTLTITLLMGLCVQKIITEKRSAAMGFFQAIYGIGMTIGPVAMGFITDNAGLQAGFLFMAGVAVLSMFGAGLFLRVHEGTVTT